MKNAALTAQNTTTKKPIKLQNMLLDVYFFERPKVRVLAKKFGAMARLFLVDLMVEMSRSGQGSIDDISIELLAVELGLTNFNEIVQEAIRLEIFYSCEGRLFCQDVDACLDRVEGARERWRENKRAQKGKTSTEIPRGIHEESSGFSNLNLNLNLNPNSNLLKKEGGVGGVLTAEAETEVDRWNQYLIKANRRPLDAISREALALTYAGRSNELIADIRRSIVNRWKTIQPGALEAQASARDTKQAQGKPSKKAFNVLAEEAALATVRYFQETEGKPSKEGGEV